MDKMKLQTFKEVEKYANAFTKIVW